MSDSGLRLGRQAGARPWRVAAPPLRVGLAQGVHPLEAVKISFLYNGADEGGVWSVVPGVRGPGFCGNPLLPQSLVCKMTTVIALVPCCH